MGTTDNLESRKEQLIETAKELSKTIRHSKNDDGFSETFKVFKSAYTSILNLIQNTVIKLVEKIDNTDMSEIISIAEEKTIIKDRVQFQKAILSPKIYSEEKYIGGYENALNDVKSIVEIADHLIKYMNNKKQTTV